MELDVVDEAFVFFFGPSSFVGVFFLATRGSTHGLRTIRYVGCVVLCVGGMEPGK